ncbi:MAG: alkaline phosphatase family protein [Planctomycetes bacterium]|nr:alkaline phosphatase family protein [Planctomycetota bacterium]
MNDLDRLFRSFQSGAFLAPRDDVPALTHLSQALASAAGAGPIALNPAAERIAALLGSAEHLVLVLVDGLGMNLLDALPPQDFFRRRLAMELRTVYPSSTAPALTTLATGQWPSTHAVPAWWTYLPEAGLTATVLPFVERFTRRPLAEYRMDVATVYPASPLLSRYRLTPHSYLPRNLVETETSKYLRGGTPATGYDSLAAGVDAILARLRSGPPPSFTYLYYPDVDSVAHEHGAESDPTRRVVQRTQRELTRLADGLSGRARLAITADHGSISVPVADRHFLAPDDPLIPLLNVPPSGEFRVSMFHVRSDCRTRFEGEFRNRFGDRFLLLRTAEAAEAELFGPGPLSPILSARLGDYVSIALGCATLLYGPPVYHREEAVLVGYHGGLTPEEMRVPLIISP